MLKAWWNYVVNHGKFKGFYFEHVENLSKSCHGSVQRSDDDEANKDLAKSGSVILHFKRNVSSYNTHRFLVSVIYTKQISKLS